MVITKIERQKRHPERVNVYCDGEFAFGIHREVLTKFGLRKGDEITTEAAFRIGAEEEFSQAKQKALRLIGYRLRTEQELRTTLIRKDFQPATVDHVIAHLRDIGMVDDMKFARAYLHDTQLKKPSGRLRLTQELRGRGLRASTIEETLRSELSPKAEEKLALAAGRKLLDRYRRSSKRIEAEKQKAHIAQFLTRRGFEWGIVRGVLRKLLGESEMTEPEE